MKLFKRLRKSPILSLPIWNREKNLAPKDCLERDLNWNTDRTNEDTEIALSKIHDVMRDQNLSYKEAVTTDTGRQALFQLLLHRQWVAFHAESLRIVEANENKISGLGLLTEYREQIEKKVGKQAMDQLLNQFTEETESYFSKKIKEDFEW
jgi:hypothetical protein